MFKSIGMLGNADFIKLIASFKETNKFVAKDFLVNSSKLTVCIRKRGISEKEVEEKNLDCVSCFNPCIIVHSCKLRVDKTPYLDNLKFAFDNVFDETTNTETVYNNAVESLVPFVVSGNNATIFAYGQTGSGILSFEINRKNIHNGRTTTICFTRLI